MSSEPNGIRVYLQMQDAGEEFGFGRSGEWGVWVRDAMDW